MNIHTTFRIGGCADYYVQPSSIEELQSLIQFLNKSDIKYCVIGNGSNLLVSDKGIRGVVIQLSDTFDEVEYIDDVTVKVMSGMMLSRLGNKLADKGLAGFEFATGIPGSVGGAVRMNAGAYGGEIKDIIVSADVLDRSGRLISLSRDELELGYRTSCIAAMDYIVVSAVFRLQKGDTDTIKALIKELAVKRRAKQPLEYPSAGSTFKRPQGFFAAKLIEDAGLKGVSVGGAMVSEKHSGFVVNTGNATAKDVCMLTDMVKDKVKQQSGVDLELEVIKLGDFS
jgi:UDP-N-acetylmuramate dehydrogenase